MRLRAKTFLIISVVFTALVSVLSLSSNTMITSGVHDFEQRNTKAIFNNLRNELHSNQEYLTAFARSWAWWDDAYQFASHPSEIFIQSNFRETTFSDIQIDLLAYFSPQKHSIWAKQQGPEENTLRELSAQTQTDCLRVLEQLAPSSTSSIHGITTLGEDTYMVSALRILTSRHTGPPRGYLIAAKRITPEFIKYIAHQIGHKVSILQIDAPPNPLPGWYTKALTSPTPIFYRDPESVVCAGTLPSLSGQPQLVVAVHEDRQIRAAAIAVSQNNLVNIALTGLGMAGVIFMLLHTLVLRRITSLQEQLSLAENRNHGQQQIKLEGKDELSQLAERINRVLSELTENEQFLHTTLQSLSVGVVFVDAQTRKIVEANTCANTLFALSRKEMLGRSCKELLCPERAGQRCPVLEQKQQVEGERVELLRHNNTPLTTLKTVIPIRKEGRPLLLEMFVDISELAHVQKALKESEARYKAIFTNTGTASIMADTAGTILLANTEFANLAAEKAPEKLYATSLLAFFPTEEQATLLAMLQSAELRPQTAETSFHTKTGNTAHVTLTIAPVPGTSHRIVSLLDITARIHAERQLEQQAFHDMLTGLPNRQLFTDRLDHALENASRKLGRVGLLLLDLDGFKFVNDSLGHEAGDRLLQEVGERLRHTLRPNDTVARLGGDEFAIIAENEPTQRTLSRVAGKVLQSFEEPFHIKGTQLHLGTSIGITLFPDDGWDPHTLMRNADLAMYQAKADGKSTFEFYTEDLNRIARDQLEMEQHLRLAINNKELCVYYQPKVDMLTGMIIGMEALVRWQHPTRGLVSPETFIPFAETTGLVVPMDLWVLQTAIRQTQQWNKTRRIPLILAVNLSARHFRNNDLPQAVEKVLQTTGMPPENLELELTETVLMEDLQQAEKIIRHLNEQGVSLALDDFGTGFSSLNYLRKLPFHTLKLDRGFIKGLCAEQNDEAFLVRTMTELGRHYGMNVVAEGIDAPSQVKQLTALGCQLAQGYLFAPPLTAKEFGHLLENETPFKHILRQSA